MTNDPNQVQGRERRRRSDRHSAQAPRAKEPEIKASYHPDETAPLPLGSETRTFPAPPQPLPPRPQASTSYDYDRFTPPDNSRDDDDEYDDDPPRLWPKLLALALGLVLVLGVGLYFLVPKDSTGILGSVRGGLDAVVDGAKGLVGLAEEKKPSLIKFETPESLGQVGLRTVFTFTADMPVDSVRMVDEVGSEVIGQLAKIDPQGTVWTLSVVFEEGFNSVFRGDILKDGVWYEGDKLIEFMAEEPLPIATDLPDFIVEATPEPIDHPAALQEPAAAPLALGEAAGDQQADDLSDGDFIIDAPEDTFVDDGAGLEEPADEGQGALTAAQTEGPSAEPFVVLRNTGEPGLVANNEALSTSGALDEWDQVTQAPEELPKDEPVELLADEPVPEEPEDAGQPALLSADDAPLNEWDEVPPEDQQPLVADGTPTSPQASVMQVLPLVADESALPSNLKMSETVYEKGKKVKALEREVSLNMPGLGDYASYDGGVFTFRDDAFRANAAFGEAELPLEQMSLLWKAPLGSLRTGDGTLYGLGWTSQPAIVKWSLEVRAMMNITEAKKDVKALKEVIVGAQDGKIYFFDLNDGVATREPIDIGYPLKGSVSVDTQVRPMLAVGQGISKMPNKTGPIGLYVYDLIEQKELMFLNGRKTKTQSQYSTNGAFDGTPLFDRNTDSMIVAGENGLLYTVALNTDFDYLDKMTIKLNPVITFLKSKTGAQKDMSVSNEASVAMYGKYVYTADRQGIIKAVDTDSMLTQWAFDAGDNTDATPALGFDEDGSLGLYTGTTVFSRTKKAGTALIRRLDALSGKEVWKVEVPAKYSDDERAGVKGSPVVGEKGLSDLVIFTVNRTNDGNDATVMAYNKQTGAEVWSFALNTTSISSPVAVYTSAGEGYIVQADEKGTLYLIKGATGELLNTLELDTKIEASPAVYNDVLVIGSCEKDNSFLYGIRLE